MVWLWSRSREKLASFSNVNTLDFIVFEDGTCHRLRALLPHVAGSCELTKEIVLILPPFPDVTDMKDQRWSSEEAAWQTDLVKEKRSRICWRDKFPRCQERKVRYHTIEGKIEYLEIAVAIEMKQLINRLRPRKSEKWSPLCHGELQVSFSGLI